MRKGVKKFFLLGFSKRVIVFCFLRTFEEIVIKGLLILSCVGGSILGFFVRGLP